MVLSEITHRDGLLTGSHSLDHKLWQHMEDVLGKNLFSILQQQYPDMLHKIRLESWEDAKKAFDGTGKAAVHLPPEVVNNLPAEVSCCQSHVLK